MRDDLIGMDFGTTNSGMAFYDAETGRVRLLPLDPASANPQVARTALYLTNHQELVIGRQAVERFLAENTGRPVRMERVWVGEIEVRAEDMYYVTDVYVFTDVLSPGRLFLSIKSGLRDPDYLGTVVGRFYYSLEDLIALYLTTTKKRAEKQLGRPLNRVVLGRPVRFAFEPEKDRLAQNRLLDAALRAGYETVYFQVEPIAAAYDYAATLTRSENILVFDFGGGTLDVTIMRVGPQKKKILATGGIPLAGDVFDQKLTRAKLPRHFGEGSRYNAGRQTMPVPGWIYDIFSDWQRILELQSPERRAMLEEIARGAHRPREIEALISLIADNYGLQMFDAVEKAKRRLSTDLGTLITFSAPKFNVRQVITRTEFEAIIHNEVRMIDEHLDDLVARAGLAASDIDSVVRTGGSAQIPIFCELLEEKFGADRVQAVDTFSSVTAGLGLIAKEIAAGASDLRPYTRADLRRHSVEKKSNVGSASLELLQKRITLQEEGEGGRKVPARVVVTLQPENRLAVIAWPASQTPAPAEPEPLDPTAALMAGYDEQLLLATNRYRFLLLTPRQLDELADLNLQLRDMYHLRDHEQVEAIASWERIRDYPWLVLATSRGFARAFRLEQLVERIESPAPYQLDDGPPGVPIALLGVGDDRQIILVNEDGRALRLPLADRRLRLRGTQAINWREGERIVAAVDLPAGDPPELLLVTADGYGRRIATGDLPLVESPNQRPPIQAARKPTRFLLPWQPGERITFWMGAAFRPLDPERVPPPDRSTRTIRLIKLPSGTRLAGAIVDRAG